MYLSPFPLLPSFKIVEHKGDNYSYNVGMREFAEFLKRKGYVIGNNEDKILQLIEVCRKTNTMPAFVIFGPPGVGKTWFTQLLAEFLNAEYLFYQATFGTTDDDLLYRFVPSENTVSGIEIIEGILPQSLRLSNNKLVVVVIDEFDKTRPSADALLLDYLQNARVSVKINNEEQYIIGDKSKIIFFITSNKVRDLSEPLLRRLMKLTFGFHNPEEVKKILSRHFGEELADTLKNIYMLNLEKELIKPITIQELIQFGYAIQEIKDIDFLIKTILLKEVEDYSNHSETIKLLLTDYLKLVEVFPIEELKNLEVFEEVDEGTNVAFKVLYEESTANGLTKLILLNPELEKKFKKVKVGTEKYIISEEPLTLKEFLLLEDYSGNCEMEAIIESLVFVNIANLAYKLSTDYYKTIKIKDVTERRLVLYREKVFDKELAIVDFIKKINENALARIKIYIKGREFLIPNLIENVLTFSMKVREIKELGTENTLRLVEEGLVGDLSLNDEQLEYTEEIAEKLIKKYYFQYGGGVAEYSFYVYNKYKEAVSIYINKELSEKIKAFVRGGQT